MPSLRADLSLCMIHIRGSHYTIYSEVCIVYRKYYEVEIQLNFLFLLVIVTTARHTSKLTILLCNVSRLSLHVSLATLLVSEG